ncbi:MAG TPA: choice-of-anchor V domain-containing protein, partial [Chitinophagales bacterium]|nr:choice-of-anchor V domain-containing protein [Chitinophagales bacterium]
RRLTFAMGAFLATSAFIFSGSQVRSSLSQPPATYTNDPPFNQSCVICHACVPSHDSTNFVLQMGADTTSLADVISGGTTYTPGATYFMRITGNVASSTYGFELTATDSAHALQSGVTDFTVLNATTTSLSNISGRKYIGHKDADATNVWTFTWVAPTAYHGPITFYWAGNDGNGDLTQTGDQVYLVHKTITAVPSVGINSIDSKVAALNVFPTVFNNSFAINFNLEESARVSASLISVDGKVVKTLMGEELSAGNISRSFNANELSPGLYLLKLQVNGAYTVSKLVKE